MTCKNDRNPFGVCQFTTKRVRIHVADLTLEQRDALDRAKRAGFDVTTRLARVCLFCGREDLRAGSTIAPITRGNKA